MDFAINTLSEIQNQYYKNHLPTGGGYIPMIFDPMFNMKDGMCGQFFLKMNCVWNICSKISEKMKPYDFE